MAKKKQKLFWGNTAPARKQVQIAKEVRITEAQHESLMHHLKLRLQMGAAARDQVITSYEHIDREIACYLKLDADDQKRARDTKMGKGIKPWDIGIPLALVQIDEAITYLLQVTAPDQSMYGATAPKDKQQLAAGFAALMNLHADQFGHYLAYARMFFDMLKYNFGGSECDWVDRYGNAIEAKGSAGLSRDVRKNVVVASGNELDPIDPYNFLYDSAVPAVKLCTDGEFYAKVRIYTEFRIRKMAAEGKLFGIDRFINGGYSECTYWKPRPLIRGTGENPNGDSGMNWVGILSMTQGQEIKGFELVTITAWIVPSEWGLSNADEYQIWRFKIAQGRFITDAVPLDNAHGLLPIAIARPWDDGFEMQTKSFAEHLLPYQRFSSFQLNVHQRSARKKLYGIMIYDKNVVPLMEQADLLGGKVPANPTAQGTGDISKSVHYVNDGPDTQNTLKDVEAMANLMQKILPTDMLRQVADLERATKYQAAATVQGANRRNLKIAKVIDKQALVRLRHMQMYNVYQYQDQMEVLTPQGELVQVKPIDLIGQNIEFTIADGLRGLDRLLLIETLKDVINVIVQNPEAAAQVDVLQAINYFTSMIGDNTDFTQFRIKSPMDKLPPDQRTFAFQLLQQYMAAQQGQGAGGQAGASASASGQQMALPQPGMQ